MLKVLVVEDDVEAREALVSIVRQLGHDCRSATDGREAWVAYQRERADVIVCEWRLPHVDGLELCRLTRVARDQGAYTYFILLTDYADKEHFIRGMEAGADDFQRHPMDADELRARLTAAGRVIGLYRELAEKNALLRRDSLAAFRTARVDALTAIANRRAMDEELVALWSRVARYGHRYSLAICDIDRFKDYNDHFGHVAGDDVLRRVAETIGNELRSGDSLYRYGGEEFVVLLPEQPLAEAMCAMDRVRAAVKRRAIPAPGERNVLTISVGVAGLDPSVDRAPEDWLQRADVALYRAKGVGRDRVEAGIPDSTRSA